MSYDSQIVIASVVLVLALVAIYALSMPEQPDEE